MNRIKLGIVFFFLMNCLFAQTIEVNVTDTIMCKVEKYNYFLTVKFYTKSKEQEFEKYLTSNGYRFDYFYDKAIVEETNEYVKGVYNIEFNREQEKIELEGKMKLAGQFYTLSLIEMKVVYEEKEKLRLIRKLVKKGEDKAKLLAIGLERNLGEIINIKESYDTDNRENIPEDKVKVNFMIGSKTNHDKRNEGKIIKTIIITFDTKE